MVAQTYVAPGRVEPKVKASQCFTKYKWRDLDAAKRQSGPQIVATQVRPLPPPVALLNPQAETIITGNGGLSCRASWAHIFLPFMLLACCAQKLRLPVECAQHALRHACRW